MNFFKEFKTFVFKGNVLDLAIGIVIGAAFGKMTSSLVGDMVTPTISLLTGTIDFSDKVITLKEATETSAALTLKYGLFLNTLIELLIIGLVMFVLIKQVNYWRRTNPAPEPSTRECPFCYSVIQKKAQRCPACTSEIIPEVSTSIN
jgi:large conductance mechanosensitive channel